MNQPHESASSSGALHPADRYPADLYLIDTMGYIFRAYHAMPRLTNSRGMPTQAVLGFTNMLRKLLSESQPRYIAAAFDLAGPTFREETYAAYKANRPSMPEELARQLPYIRRVLEAYRIPILEFQGFEADDVIGTFSRKAAEQGHFVVIVSSDKDMLQLVNGNVRVLNPSRGDLLYDAATVREVMGVEPRQVIDLLALRGDAIDNIPGAPGIGEKGALALVQRFGSVEAALEHADEVERKTYRESLQQNREQILMSKALATIHTDVPLPYDLEALARREPDVEACRQLFQELEFGTLLKSLPGVPQEEGVPASLGAWNLPHTEAVNQQRLAEWLEHVPASHPLALAVAGRHLAVGGAASVVTFSPEEAGPLTMALSDAHRRWLVHDLKSLRRSLRQLKLPLLPADAGRVEDVQLLAYLLDPTQSGYGLDAIAKRCLGAIVSVDVADRAGMGADMNAAMGAAVVASTSASLIAALAPVLRAEVDSAALAPAYRDLDLPLVPVLEEMEDHGVLIDPEEMARLSSSLEQRLIACQQRIFDLCGTSFNLNSPKQLGEVLFGRLGLPQPPRRGKTKSLSTAVDVLEELADQHEVVGLVLEYRQLSKLKSTYVDVLPRLVSPETGRLHTTFSQVGTATGRLSSSNPNLQNIPIRTEMGRQIRAAFVAAPGHLLISADYSQIELRLLAHFSQDPLLLDAYRKGDDIHRLTAAEVFGVPPLMITDEHRHRAKAVNFGIVYGLSAFGLAKQLGISQGEAAQFIKRYFERYVGVQRFIQETLEQARREEQVRTLFGRLRPIPDINTRNANLRGFAERTAINTPLQGTAADLMKLAMIRVQERLRDRPARLILQVHDELVLETPKEHAAEMAALLREEMANVYPLSVPLDVDVGIGPNWDEMETVEA